MDKVSIIGLDLAKRAFQAHGARADGGVAFRKKLSREKVLSFMAEQAPCVVAMEACGSAHHWARAIGDLGHEVRLIPPAYVKPFVKRQKNDAADAEAICEAASRPTMRFVAIKTEEQQARAMLFRTRDILVRQRTQLINALRGHLSEHGMVVPQGPSRHSSTTRSGSDAVTSSTAFAIAFTCVFPRTNRKSCRRRLPNSRRRRPTKPHAGR
jgi:transposase